MSPLLETKKPDPPHVRNIEEPRENAHPHPHYEHRNGKIETGRIPRDRREGIGAVLQTAGAIDSPKYPIISA